MSYIDELLGRDESIVYEARPHVILLVSRIIAKIALIGILVATAIVSFEAFRHNTDPVVAGFTANQLIPALSVFISALLLISIFSDFLFWNAEHFVITERRVIQLHGALTKTVIDSPLEKINDVRMTQSLPGRMLHYGTIIFSTSSEDGSYTLENMVEPLNFKRAMLEAKQNYERGFGYLDGRNSLPQATFSSYAVDSSTPNRSDIQHTIEELASLRDRGILSMDEFEAKKRELLSRT